MFLCRVIPNLLFAKTGSIQSRMGRSEVRVTRMDSWVKVVLRFGSSSASSLVSEP